MKKDNDQSAFSSKPVKFVFYLLLSFFGLFFAFRIMDSSSFYLDFPYGHFHFPLGRQIPFFKEGEREFGEIDQFGFRKGSVKKNTKCNYLLLGDSQTFGSGLFWKDSFPEILNRETDCRWFNISIPGSTLENQFSMYQKVSSHLEFSHVYLFVYGNDIYETGDTPDYLHFVNHKKWYVHFLSFFFPEHTRLYLKKKYFESIQKRMESELERVSIQPYQAPNLKKRKDEIADYLPLKTLFQISPTYLSSSLDTKTYAKVNFDRWKKILLELNYKILDQGKHLTIVYIPLEVEFDKSRYDVYQGIGFVMNPKWLESDSELVEDLVQVSAENQIPFVDMRSWMRYRTDLLQKGDIHLNEVATRLIADILKNK
ncbi:SGNH/GDSL hydrolase family protein [Leptospira perdikensis]|uniref:SGNH/GDSL hydrolase family protein n=1 Tax=Leptospira perdikensis TaxID=2484948 RepID=A0A4R9JGP8_9LEPT|nr:SGNH/GDSL hydrolase family protein [Leptospira perdikensis]TGL40312.1 SGNH/GDSL hydrolase family protein [Leptospira perdikensis]